MPRPDASANSDVRLIRQKSAVRMAEEAEVPWAATRRNTITAVRCKPQHTPCPARTYHGRRRVIAALDLRSGPARSECGRAARVSRCPCPAARAWGRRHGGRRLHALLQHAAPHGRRQRRLASAVAAAATSGAARMAAGVMGRLCSAHRAAFRGAHVVLDAGDDGRGGKGLAIGGLRRGRAEHLGMGGWQDARVRTPLDWCTAVMHTYKLRSQT